MGNWYKTYLVALLCILGMTSIYSQDITRTTDPSQLLSGRISVFSVDTTSATVNSIAGIFRSFSGGSIDSIAVGDYFWASNKTKHYIASVDSVSDNIIYFKVAHKSGETASPGVGAILGYDRGYPTTPEGINSELKAAIESDFRNEIAYQTITQLDSLSHLLTYNGVLGELVQIKGGKIYKIESTGTPSEDKVILLNNSTYAVYQEPVTRFVLNGTNLEVAVGGDTSTVDLGGLSLSASPPILGQTSEPTNQRVFWKDTDGDTTRVKAPYADQGYKDLAYHHEMRSAIDSLKDTQSSFYQGKAILDTIPLLNGINQTRLDSMNLIGITHGTVNVQSSTSARDSLYPDGFVIALYGSDSMIVAYSGIIIFPDSVFTKGKNYYQPYEFKKYQESPDSILEQLVFKALDTNIIEIRDRYSYLSEGASQSSRNIPAFTDTTIVTLSSLVDNTLIAGWELDTSNVAFGSLVSGIEYNIDSIECNMGTNAGSSNFDLIIGNGSTYTGIIDTARFNTSSSPFILKLDETGIKMRGTGSLGSNLTYVIFYNHVFSSGRNPLIGEVTGTGETTAFIHDQSGTMGWFFDNNEDFTGIAATGASHTDGIFFSALGYNGANITWNVKNNASTQRYPMSDFQSGSSANAAPTFEQLQVNDRDDAVGEHGNWRIYRYIFIFQGQLTDTEVYNLANAMGLDKKIIE